MPPTKRKRTKHDGETKGRGRKTDQLPAIGPSTTFKTLPREVRDMIYNEVLGDPLPEVEVLVEKKTAVSGYKANKKWFDRRPLNLLLVDRQVSTEYREAAFRQGLAFQFFIHGGNYSFAFSRFGLPSTPLRWIRRFTLDICFLEEDYVSGFDHTDEFPCTRSCHHMQRILPLTVDCLHRLPGLETFCLVVETYEFFRRHQSDKHGKLFGYNNVCEKLREMLNARAVSRRKKLSEKLNRIIIMPFRGGRSGELLHSQPVLNEMRSICRNARLGQVLVKRDGEWTRDNETIRAAVTWRKL